MRRLLSLAVQLAVVAWQVEMAVHAGIAASKRPAKFAAQPTIRSSSPTQSCPQGAPCPPSQPQPQARVIAPR